MNIDIGGGTSKLALCEGGAVVAQTALDIGARIVVFDGDGRVERLEEAARRLADELGLRLAIGERLAEDDVQLLVERMADHLLAAAQGGEPAPATAALLRLEPLPAMPPPSVVTFSGGVAEYVYGTETRAYGDLGPALAAAVRRRIAAWSPRLERPDQGIRATVVGASQYTVQVSGSTIFVEPTGTLPLRNVAVVAPALPLDAEELDVEVIAQATRSALRRLDLHEGTQAVALTYRWAGSATFARLDAFCRGVTAGLAAVLQAGHPLVLVGDGDIGGLVGIHAHAELKLPQAVVSIDGITLHEFDYIDIGALMDTSGAVPVVIKSLVFPGSAALGRAA